MKPTIFSHRDMDVILLTMKVGSCLTVIKENETNECAMAVQVPASEYPLKALLLRQAIKKKKALRNFTVP